MANCIRAGECIIGETLISTADGIHPTCSFVELFAQHLIVSGIGLELEHRRNHLQAVLDAVIDLLEQDFMTIKCGMQFALILLSRFLAVFWADLAA